MRKIIILIFLIIVSAPVLSIGASPASLNFPGMLRNGYSSQIVTVSNPSDQEVSVVLAGEGEISTWITPEPDNIILGPGESAPVLIKVEPPADIANGHYRNDILILGSPTSAGDGQVSIIGGVSLAVTAEITDKESKTYTIRKTYVPATEECRPIEIRVIVLNTGNVRTSADLFFTIRSGETVFQTKQYTSETMLPTHEYSFLVDIPYEVEQYNCIPVGKYEIDFSANLDGNIIHSETLALIISERGSLAILGELSNIQAPIQIDAGQLARIQADFKNTGELTYRAQLIGEIYSNAVLVDTIKGDVSEVLTNELQTLSLFYRPTMPGDYTLTIYAADSISGARTKPVDIQISVALPILYIGAALLILAILAYFILKKRGSNVQNNAN